MKLRKLSAGFGAEADAVPPDFGEVWDAFFASQVLVFRNQRFTSAGFLSFARQFGKPEPHVIDQFHHPEHPDILILSNVQKDGQPIGLIEIPRLGLSSVVLEGDDTAALLLGVGHLSDTPLPWHGGNTVFAAHRDTFFRPLAHIRKNDVIRFSTADASFDYVVTELKVVEPTAVEVLEPTSAATLTLITCFPFDFIGLAPQRFIVKAARRSSTSLEPEA